MKGGETVLKRLLAMLLAVLMLPAGGLSEGEEAAPTATPAVEAPAPTPEPTPDAAKKPRATKTPKPAKAKWNEKKCDHANLNCTQAPKCTKKNCVHIRTDVHGNDIPLCARGRWVLDAQDKLQRAGKLTSVSKSVRTQVIDLDKGNASLYRSGSYTVKGGENREGATLTIAKDRLVVLTLNNVAAEKITLQAGANVTILTVGVSDVTTLTANKNVTLQFTSGGHMTIEKVEQHDTAKIAVTGGSVNASFKEKAGRKKVRFDAPGATAVTVEGESYAADTPDKNGRVHLWLAAAGAGSKWLGEMQGTILTVTRETDAADETAREIIPGEKNILDKPGVYTLSGGIAPGTLLQVTAKNVTIRLDNASAALSAPLIDAQAACTVSLKGANVLSGAALASGKKLTFSGSGTMQLDEVGTSAAFSCGQIVLGKAPAGFVRVDCPVDPVGYTLTIDGKKATLIATPGGRLILPDPVAGKEWTVTVEGSTIVARSQKEGAEHFDLSVNPVVKSGAETINVDGAASRVEGSVTATAKATLNLRKVRLTGSGAVLTLRKDATVRLTGNNVLHTTGSNAVSLKNNAKAKLIVRSGRLTLRQRNMKNLTLQGNIQVEPAAAGATVITIRDSKGEPVCDRELTVRIAGQTYEYTTFSDGTLHLWGLGNLKGEAIAATDGKMVFTAVLPGKSATGDAPAQHVATADMRITDVEAEDLPDGTVRVTFKAENAGSAGVMFLTGTGEQALADDFVSAATLVQATGGEAILTGVEPGADISLRVYATETAGVTLTARSADGFKFSEKIVHHHRGLFAAKIEDTPYTGEPWVNPVTLPEGAKMVYEGETLTDGVPVEIGSYVMRVTIPEGSDRYLPGTYEVPFQITKIMLTIVPGPNMFKYVGQEDPPEFPYTVKGLLPGDKVTGKLKRKEGEEPGNYKFLLDGLSAPAYYRFRLPAKSSTFTILPIPSFDMPVFYEMLHPVRQEIARRDGRTVAVVLNTQDSMTVTYSRIGEVVYDMNNRQKPFSPSLSWNEETDEVLLRVRTEAELNKDGGYVTDNDGNPLWTGRYMRLSWLGYRLLNNIGVDAVSFSCHGAAITLRIEDLLGDAMQAFIKENRGDLKNARFRLSVEPMEEAEKGSMAASDALHPVSRLWRVGVTLILDKKEIDVTGLIPSLTVSVAMEETRRLLQTMGRYEETTFSTQYQLYALPGEETAFAGMDSAFVRPWMPDEMTLADFPAAMYTYDYLLAPLKASGLVTVAIAGK